MNKIVSFRERILNKLVNSKLIVSISSSTIAATLVLVGIVVFWSFPSYDVALFTHEIDENWTAFFLQVKEPFVNHTDLWIGHHADKFAFRFVPAVICKILNIHSLLPALIFQFFTVVIFYYFLILVFNDILRDKAKAFIFALPFCFVISGHVYTSDIRGIFDTLALDFLLMAFLFRNKLFVIIPLLLAYFTDERALIVSPIILLTNLYLTNNYESIKKIKDSFLSTSNLYLFSSWILYFVFRFSLGEIFGLASGTSGVNYFIEHLNRTFYTLYIGLEGFIIPFAIIIFVLMKSRNYAFSFLIILNYLILFYIAQSVIDINRSMSYLVLFLILILIILDRSFPKEKVYSIVSWVILVNLIYDDFYPLLAQLYRMKYITHTI